MLPEGNTAKVKGIRFMTPETSTPSPGFQKEELVRLPETFFSQLLPLIDSLTQLRLLLYIFWHSEQQDGKAPFFTLADFTADPTLMQIIGDEKILENDLANLVSMNILLKSSISEQSGSIYFINSPKGRAAVHAIETGEWLGSTTERKAIQLKDKKPNIFRLYEENIGAITPMIAEILKEDEKTYPDFWIEEAIQIALKRNVRNWKYVQAILQRWQKEGRGYEQNRRDNSQDPSRYRRSWLGEE